MKKILFVCLGNICRSPLAQGIFEKKIKEMGLEEEYYADSAGTSGWHEGEPPHSGSRNVAKQNNVNIDRQRSRPVRITDGQEFDYIVAMDTSNAQSLRLEFSISPEKILLMRSFEKPSKAAGQKLYVTKDVPDPWGHGQQAFQDVYNILETSMEGLIDFLQKESKNL